MGNKFWFRRGGIPNRWTWSLLHKSYHATLSIFTHASTPAAAEPISWRRRFFGMYFGPKLAPNAGFFLNGSLSEKWSPAYMLHASC